MKLNSDYSIIVHSHLGWDWVWQRPQQFFSRLSSRHKILFVEGPLPETGLASSYFDIRGVPNFPNITVVRSRLPESKWKNRGYVDNERFNILKKVLEGPLGHDFQDPIQWFYDPMAVTAFAGQMNEQLNVYDCMDQLTLSRGADIAEREQELLSLADVVFAGGPKISREKRKFNSNTHSYSCGVEMDHFSTALKQDTLIPEELQGLPHPILGFMGVIDNKMDLDLVSRLSKEFSEGSLVFVGPINVEPSRLPNRSNIHWLGAKPYRSLPSYAKAFDVCLLPFARNEATEFLNPTKVLEYMAAGKPIVSTSITDVVDQFGDVVHIAFSPKPFVELCRFVLNDPNKVAINRGLTLARERSWEKVVAKFERHIEDALIAKSQESFDKLTLCSV